MRLDRLVTLNCAEPLMRVVRRRRGLRIPILMYHSVAEDTDASVRPYFRTVTSPAVFRQHMEFLAREGFESLTLSEGVARLDAAKLDDRRSENCVVITFDDGFRDLYSCAFPIMQQYKMKATVFMSTGFIGQAFETGRECLQGWEIRALAAEGVQFGSHTVTHPQLSRLPWSHIRDELSTSKLCLEQVVGSEIVAFSYPYRFPEQDKAFVSGLRGLLRELGYSVGVTTVIGRAAPNDEQLFLKRLPANECDDVALLRAKLCGAYDWMHVAQLGIKTLRALRQVRGFQRTREESSSGGAN